jgi:hypothetical protein
MKRIIKPSGGTYTFFGAVLAFPFALSAIICAFKGHLPNSHLLVEDGQVFAWLAALLLPIAVITSRNRIVVTDTELIAYPPLSEPIRARFSEISSSIPRVLVQRSHPGLLIISFTDETKESVTLPLTKFPSADVAWLLSLKQLKVKR